MGAPKGNKYAIGNRGGKPPKFKTAKDLATAVDSYFEYIKGEQVTQMQNVVDPITKTAELKEVKFWKREPEKPLMFGMILFLGFNSPQALDRYEDKNDEYVRVVSLAKARIAMWYEKNLLERGVARGAAFALSNIVGWGNRIEQAYRDKDGKLTNPPANAVILTNAMPDTNTSI